MIERQTLYAVATQIHSLALLRQVLSDDASQAVLHLINVLGRHDSSTVALTTAHAEAFAALATVADDEPVAGLNDAWQAHLTARLIDDANPWSRQAEGGGADGVARGIVQQAARELQLLRQLFDCDAIGLHRATEVALQQLGDPYQLPEPWLDLASPLATDSGTAPRATLRMLLADEHDWAALLPQLSAHWARHGTGVVARYRSLRWDTASESVQGISHPDMTKLSDLVAYEREKELLRTNLERFIAGLPAHDALLYGAPGTGKSSMVKALAQGLAAEGLRLLEVRKDDLGALPAITSFVRGRAPRFLIFVDDLSFEEHETEYKALKVLLEGAAEARPRNLLIYATTNRRNLIRENFADRGKPDDDVHGRDTMQEKISLAARFGLRVTFASPDQERYLQIAVSLARGRGITLSDEELRKRALFWERQHAGRSGRLARQFVDDLQAELSSGKQADDAWARSEVS